MARTIIQFSGVEDAYDNNQIRLLKIYGAGEYLLWENPYPLPPIEEASDCFIFVNDLKTVDFTYYLDNIDSYKDGKIITGQFCVPHIHNGYSSSQVNTKGTTWWTSLSESVNDNFKSSLAGIKTTTRVYPAGFFQFVKFEEYEGVYLYSPEFRVIVANNSPFENWTYTGYIEEGFDISPYFTNNYDPFNDDESTWTTVSTKYRNGAHGYETPEDTLYTTDYIYKEFNFVQWPTVIITPGRELNINDYFGYDNGTHTVTHSRCMVKPKLEVDKTSWLNINTFPKFANKITDRKSDKNKTYNCILPIRNNTGWPYTG